MKYFEERKFKEAIQCFDEALLLDNTDISIWINRGLALYHQQRYDCAIDTFKRIINREPDNVNAWRMKGFSLEKIGRKNEADQCFQKAVEIQKNKHEKAQEKKITNIFKCVRCGILFISSDSYSKLCPGCYSLVHDSIEQINPINPFIYYPPMIDMDHYE